MNETKNLIYSWNFKWYRVYIEEEPDIEKDNPSKELRKILYKIFEKHIKKELNKPLNPL